MKLKGELEKINTVKSEMVPLPAEEIKIFEGGTISFFMLIILKNIYITDI